VTLQKAVFFAGIGAYAASLIAALIMVVGVGTNLFSPRSVDVHLPVLVYGVCLALRLALALWLKSLGGPPSKFIVK
jgi:hypothetical protein